MKVTNKIAVHLDAKQDYPLVNAVQCDANTRALEITLCEGGEAWVVPSDTVVSVAYWKDDGTSGWYDKLPDGSAACTVEENVVTAILAPQVLTAVGTVKVAVVLQEADTLDQLTTFPVEIQVEPNPLAEQDISEDYYNYQTLSDVNEAMNRMEREFDNLVSRMGILCYASLSQAIADINGDTADNSITDAAAAKVKVFTTDTGRTAVMLLEDISESTQIAVNADIDLVLNGKTLTLVDPAEATPTNAAYLSFAAATNCTINGEVSGSKIIKSGGTGVATYLVNALGNLTVRGGKYSVSGTYGVITENGPNGAALCFRVYGENATLALEGCAVESINSLATATGIQAKPAQKLTLKDVQIKANGTNQTYGILSMCSMAAERIKVTADITSGPCQGIFMESGSELMLSDSVIDLKSSAAANIRGLLTNAIGAQVRSTEIRVTSTLADAANCTADGIYNTGEGTLTVTDCQITSQAQALPAYGIYNNNILKLSGTGITASSVSGDTYGVDNVNTTDFKDCVISVDASAANAFGIYNYNSTSMADSKVSANSDDNNAWGIYNVKTVDVVDSNISANSNNAHAYGVYNTGALHIANSQAFGDAPDCHSNTAAGARGISNYGDAFLRDTDVIGTHAGLSNYGNAYVNGGVLTGYCHGGIYFSQDADKAAYVNDATLRCGHYDGIHDYTEKSGEIYGSMYIGGGETANDITVYMDGCTLETEFKAPAVVLRGSSGEMNNTLNISNSTIPEADGTVKTQIIRIDAGGDESLRLNVGIGCNITTDRIDHPDYAEFTDALYRRNHADKQCNGNDYHAVLAFLQAQIDALKAGTAE